MSWLSTIKPGDAAIVIATLLGPVLAIQAQMFLDRRRALKGRRLNVFYVLMRTRATPLAPEAVNALNAIPLEFYGVAEITAAYRTFITHTNTPPANQAWQDRRIDLLMDLIHKIAQKVGYGFTVAELKSEFYAPQGHRTVEDEQNAIRAGLAKVLSGQGALPLDVQKFVGDPEAQAALKAILKGEAAINVQTTAAP